jgi:signal transduction histidine kinase
MERLLTPRFLNVAIWGILAVTVAVCGLGVHLTASHYRDMQGILLDAEKRAAENQLPAIEEQLGSAERQALDILHRSGGDGVELLPFLQSASFLHSPFLITAGGSIWLPHQRPPEAASPAPGPEPAPAEALRALRLAASGAPLAEKLDALAKLQRSGDVGPYWRLRGSACRAALERRSGDPEGAARSYESLFEEHGELLRRSLWPSYLQLSLARCETLAELGRGPAALDFLEEVLAGLQEGSLAATLEEEEFFIERARRLGAGLGSTEPPALAAVERRLVEERQALATAEAVRDLVQARARLDPDDLEDAAPEHAFRRIGGRWAVTVWKPVPPPPSGPGLAAVGFQLDLDRLDDLLEAHLPHSEAAKTLRVLAADEPPPQDFVILGALGGGLDFVKIGIEREAWNRLVGRARLPFVFAGALIGFLGMILISSLLILFRGLRRELALSRMKTEFVANVSHELKTPLALIRLCGETLQLDRLPRAEQRERYYQIITRESERLTHLIANVLNFASIEAGKKTYHLEPCDLTRVVRETLESYRMQLEDKKFEYREELAPSLPLVLADQEAVAQALINLLQNAVKYSPDTRRIEVSTRAEAGSVRLAVRDHGVGISKEDQSRIWEDYYRTREARALGTRGSGLGLSLVQHIMKAHSGNVELASEPGAGSEFTLVFPVAAASPREERVDG